MRPNSRCGLEFVVTALSIDHMHAVSASYLHVQSDTDSENYTCMLRGKNVMFAGLSWWQLTVLRPLQACELPRACLA